MIAVMFTDIVDSTAKTLELGDRAAHRIIRAHNRIVRDALGQHGGSEVKQTGDGIMASFAEPSQSVEAALQIQAEVAAIAKADAAVAFEIRIGIDVGEPVREDGDIFGSTVQRASRLCDAGEGGQILTSRIVCELGSGPRYRFTDLGKRPLKGFPEAVRVFSVNAAASPRPAMRAREAAPAGGVAHAAS